MWSGRKPLPRSPGRSAFLSSHNLLWLLQVFKLTAKWNKAPEVQPPGDGATALEPAVNGSGTSAGAPNLRQGLAVQV